MPSYELAFHAAPTAPTPPIMAHWRLYRAHAQTARTGAYRRENGGFPAPTALSRANPRETAALGAFQSPLR